MPLWIKKVHSPEKARDGLVICTTISAQDQVLSAPKKDVSDCYFTVSDITVEKSGGEITLN